MPSPVTLPTATIQDDFTTVLSEVHAGIIPSEKIWLSCYKEGEPSVHGKISVSLHEQDRDRIELVGSGGVELTRTSQVSVLLQQKNPHLFVRPSVRPSIV
jgi:proteasomal ATPase-associated factor 1